MKDKNQKILFLEKGEPGYILAFALLVVAVLLTMSLSIAKVISKELFFSRLVENNHIAYFAADSGIECSEYIDNILRDDSLGKSIFLNNASESFPNLGFLENLDSSIFFSSSTVLNKASSIEDVTCASDDGTYNKIFTKTPNPKNSGFVTTRQAVLDNLNLSKASYSIVGDELNATTTFGFILKNDDIESCVLVDMYKSRTDTSSEITSAFTITSTGLSSCNALDKSRVSRTIYRYSTD